MTSKLEKGPPGELYESADESILDLAESHELSAEDREAMKRLEMRVEELRSREPSPK